MELLFAGKFHAGGFRPNDERKEFWFGESCVASRIDVNVVYDPIVGSIQIIKVDEDATLWRGPASISTAKAPGRWWKP
jgi:hypothetical protein